MVLACALALTLGAPAAATADQWYKTDGHVHSSLSGDATDDIGIISQAARARGYDAIFLTDHTATSNSEIGGVVANNVTLDENDFQNWSSHAFGTLTSFTDAEAASPVNTGAKSLHLGATTGAGAYGEQHRWYKRGPNLRSGDVTLKFSVYPTRIDPGTGLYVSVSLGGDVTINARPPQGYTTSDGVVHTGRGNVWVWQIGNPRVPVSDPEARVFTRQLTANMNQWNTYTINVSDAVRQDLTAAEMPIDLNAFTQLKMAAGGQGGTADGYFDTYSLKSSTPVPSNQEFAYRNQHVHDFDTPDFTVFPSQEVGYSRHAMMFNYPFTDPNAFVLYKQGIQSIAPVQQSGYPSQLNHPGLPGGVTQQEAIDTLGEGADLMEVAERSDEEGYIKNVMVDAWDGVLKQGTQLLGAWTSDMHRVERLGPATYVLAPSRSFNPIMQAEYEGRTYLAPNDFPGRAIISLDGGPDPYAARYPTWVSPSQSLVNVHFKISDGIQPGSRIIWTSNGQPFATENVNGPSYDGVRSVPLGGAFTYVRAELKNSAGKRVAMSQPIFFRDAPSLLPAGMTYNVTGVTTPDGKGYSKPLTQGITSQSWDATAKSLSLGLTNPSGSLDAVRLTTGDQAPSAVTVDGTPVAPAATKADFDASPASNWWFDPTNSVMLLKAKQTGGTATAQVTFTDGADTAAPAAPTGLTAHSHGADQVDLSWNAVGASDLRGYTVYRSGTPVALVPAGTTTYSDTELPGGTHFSYTVDAYDAAENHSPPSDPAGATTDTLNTTMFATSADSYTDASQPAKNFGSLTTLRTDGDPVIRTYLRFDVSGLQGTLEKATLRLYNNSSSNGWDVHSADNAWTETGINAGNAPVPSDTLYGSSNGGAAGTWSTAEVTPLISGNGTVTFELDTVSPTAASYSSRTGPNAPQLVIDTSTHTNNAPTAGDTTIATGVDTDATWTPDVNDLDGDTITCSVDTQPAHGTATVEPDCSGGTYSPEAGYSGFDSFTYTATDINGDPSAPANVGVAIGSPDNPPIADDLALTTTRDSTGAPWTPSVSDADAGDTTTCSIVDQPAHGTATVANDCSGGTYTPNPGYTGSDPFTYKATDNHNVDSTPATVSVDVKPPNNAPTAADRSVTTVQNQPGSWTPSVSDADSGDTATCAIVSQPTHGTATVASNCSSGSYTPAGGYSGPDSFTYRATDNHGAESNTATVSATVNLPFSDGFESGNLNAWGTTKNLTVQSATVHNGTFAARANTTAGVAYARKVLPATYSDLTYTAWFRPAAAPTATATVMRLRTAAGAALLSLNTNTTLRLGLRNDVTAVGKTSTRTLTAGTWYQLQLHAIVNGTSSTIEVFVDGTKIADLSSTGSNLGTTPIGEIQIGENNTGPGYDYTWDDVSAAATNAPAPPANHAPTAGAASLTTAEDVQGSWTPSVADQDAGDTTTCAIVSQPAHGTATVANDCSSGTYKGNADYNGPDSFTYRATDNHSEASTPATVSATVTAVNDAPSAADRSLTTAEDVQGSWTPSVSDVDTGDTATCAIVSQPAHGSATVASDCSGGTYKGDANYNGSDSFTYRATDNHATDSAAATVSATVTAVNDAPSAANRSLTTNQDTAGSWTPSVSDPDGGAGLTCSIVSQPAHGSASVASNCSSGGYTPAAGYSGSDSFTYKVSDPAGADSAPATVSATVNSTALFSDGFEAGNLSSWTSSRGLTVQAAAAHNGGFGARGQTTNGVTYAKKTLPGTYSDLTYRVWFRPTAVPATGAATILKLRSGGDVALAGLFVNSARRIGMRNEVTAISKTSATTLTLGRWYQLELHAVVSGAASTIEVRVDGTRLADISTTPTELGTSPIGILQLGENGAGATYDYAWDDVSAQAGAGGASAKALASAPRCTKRSRVRLTGARRQRVARTGIVRVAIRSANTCRLTGVAMAQRGKKKKKSFVKSRSRTTALPRNRKGTLLLRFSRRNRTKIRRALGSKRVYVLVYALPGHSVKRALAHRKVTVSR